MKITMRKPQTVLTTTTDTYYLLDAPVQVKEVITMNYTGFVSLDVAIPESIEEPKQFLDRVVMGKINPKWTMETVMLNINYIIKIQDFQT